MMELAVYQQQQIHSTGLNDLLDFSVDLFDKVSEMNKAAKVHKWLASHSYAKKWYQQVPLDGWGQTSVSNIQRKWSHYRGQVLPNHWLLQSGQHPVERMDGLGSTQKWCTRFYSPKCTERHGISGILGQPIQEKQDHEQANDMVLLARHTRKFCQQTADGIVYKTPLVFTDFYSISADWRWTLWVHRFR